MSIIQQLVQLLTQSPDSIIYHVIILLALQATFGLAWWRYRRAVEDRFVYRLSLSVAGIFISRLILALAVLWIGNQADSVIILPPLEYALDAVAIGLLVWALVPQPRENYRLGTIVLFLLVILIGFMYVTLASQWSANLDSGVVTGEYINSRQVVYWAILQMIMLGLSGVLIGYTRSKQWVLKLTILGILFISQLANLLIKADFIPATANTPVWSRLANLVAYPLLAVLAYQYNLGQIFSGKPTDLSVVTSSIEQLKITRGLLSSPTDLPAILKNGLAIVHHFFDVPFSALAVKSENDPDYLFVQSSGASPAGTDLVLASEQQSWAVKVSDWPAIKLAMQQHRQVELLPEGLGARQLHNFYQEMNITESGALLIEPLLIEDDEHGVMLLAKPRTEPPWSIEERALSVALGAILAQAISNAKDYGQPDSQDLITISKRLREELNEVKDERDKASDEANSLTGQLRQVQEQLDTEIKKVQELRTIVDEASPMANETIRSLEQRVHTLSESLASAEHSLALVAAGESGLNTDWVMRTVSRYSGELEDAQAQINHLEAKLSWQQQAEAYSQLTRQLHELRTPLTSLNAYSDIMLSESTGQLDAQQAALLMRMKTNVEQMTTKLDSFTRSAGQLSANRPSRQRIEVRETIEAAVNSVSNQLRLKRLRLDLNVASGLPPVPSEGDSFYQIVSHLLNNACQVSKVDGKLSIAARQDTIKELSPVGDLEAQKFLHLTISDSGGSRSQEMHSLIIHARHQLGEQSSQAKLSLSRHSLATATALVVALGGRTWVEPNGNQGSTFSILLPLASNGVTDRV